MGPLRRYTGFAQLLDDMQRRRGGDVALLHAGASGDGGDGDAGGMASLTWEGLAVSSRARAARLAAVGASCEAVLCDGSAACVAEVFGCALAGVQCVLVDAGAPEDQLAVQVRAGDADAIWPAGRACGALARALLPEPLERPGYGRMLFFTSGTASPERPVALSDSRLMASAWNGSSLLPLRPGDVVLNLLPLSHVFGFVCGLLWGLSCGATVALGRGKRHLFEDASFFQPTVMPMVPAMARFLAAHDMLGGRLRMALMGAAPCPGDVVESLRARGVEVHCGYGLTETASGIALSLGVDPAAMTICPDDAVRVSDEGEVLVSAPTCMMEGYYGRPDDTAAALREGWLHTGDAGRIDGRGLLHVEGRIRDVIVFDTGAKLSVPDFEARVASGTGQDDLALVQVDGSPVVALGRVRGAPDADAFRACAKDALRDLCAGARVTCPDTVELGHALPRTATGDVQRWKVQEEVARWRLKRK